VILTEARISQVLHDALVGSDASSHTFAEIDVTEDTQLKCAAVLIPLVQDGEDWNILYTRRTQRVESHKGQVSFPGGECEEGETNPEQTALREAGEEIGIDAASVRILGRLKHFITVTSFRVTPVVGVVRWPTVFRPNEHEVERIFTVPLAWLADVGNRWELPFPGRTRSIVVYHPYDGELVWGATARITVDFLRTLGF
jgi:8-oxo-dGTP pyrophosphatase MutT (NUDIX family)